MTEAITEADLDRVIELITARTGIVPRATHRDGIRAYIRRHLAMLGVNMAAYYALIQAGGPAFTQLVNEATVNETYFFREEKQFAFLRDKLFPRWKAASGGATMNIWSAACANGAEAYSLALLAQAGGIRARILASDINTNVLAVCEKGVFMQAALRTTDGAQFQRLLEPYRQKDGSFAFSADVRSTITTRQINLAELDSPRTTFTMAIPQHVIFVRNVFIYFSMELRARILRTLAERCLAPDGCLFVSMSEIAQIDSAIMPPALEKCADGNIFYFHKKADGHGK